MAAVKSANAAAAAADRANRSTQRGSCVLAKKLCADPVEFGSFMRIPLGSLFGRAGRHVVIRVRIPCVRPFMPIVSPFR